MSHRLSLLLSIGLAAGVAAAEVYVSPAGNDAWSGALAAPSAAGDDGPKATLAAALTAARQAKQGAAGYTVTLREGTWYLPETVQLGPDDSGTEQQPTRLRAFPGEQPRLVGGRRIQVLEPDDGPVRRADLKALGLGGVKFRQLFCNGERLPLARYPDIDPEDPLHGGYLYVEAPAQEGSKRSFKYHEGDLPEWQHPEGAEVFFWHSHNYYNTIVKLKSIDPSTRTIELAQDTYGAIVGNDAERYYVENLREALDAPGEWYLDREQSVLYLHPPEQTADAVLEVPTIDRAIALGEGTHDVVLEGLTIEVARTHGVRMDGTERCTVAKCVIGHTGASPEIGGWGPWEDCAGVGIFGGHHNRVIGCDISDVGSHGVKLRGGDRETLEPGDNSAENCVIHHVGVIWKQGCGVRMEGVGNRFSRNLVHDCPRFAVIFGGNDQLIELNHLHTLNLETCDTGATYTGGRDGLSPRGSVQRFNYIHDIGGYGRENGKWTSPVFSWGIYLDDLASGVEVTGNIVVGAKRGGIHIHNGRDNTLENNILLDGIQQQIEFNGWPNTSGAWTSRKAGIEQNWQKYQQNAAWAAKYPGLFAQPPGEWVQMAGNRVLRNIFAWHEPNAWLYRWRNLPLDQTEFDSNLVWHDGRPVPTGYTTVTNEVGPNLCPNAGFEDGQPGAAPTGWGFYAKPTPQAKLASSDHQPASGKLCLEVTCRNNPDPKAQFKHVMLKTGNLPVQSGKQYHLTVKLRGDRDGLPGNLVLQSFRAGQHHWAAEKGYRLTTQWQTYDLAARIPGPGEPGYKPTLEDLYIRLDFSAAEGTVWIDDVTLREAELGDEWEGWQATGHDVQSRVADPLFVARNRGDFRLKPNSPALQLGFKPIPYNRIGPYQDPLRATWPIPDNELAWHRRRCPVETIRFGFIGAGEIANASQQAVAEADGAVLTAVYDIVEQVADDIARQHGAVACREVECVLARDDVDAVYICAPHHLHAPYTIAAAAAGKHVLTEKPIATSVADADAMLAACAAHGVQLGVAFSAQVCPRTKQLREWLADGLLGRLYGTHLSAIGDKPLSYWSGGYTGRVQSDWRRHWDTAGGGMLIMNLIHNLNTMRYLSGLEATKVYASMGTHATPDIEVEDFLVGVIEYAGGEQGSIEVASTLPGRSGLGDRLYGTNGQLRLTPQTEVWVREVPDGFEEALTADEWFELETPRAKRRDIFEGFAAAVRAGTPPPADGLAGRQALAVVEACYTSARTGEPVAVAPPHPAGD